MKEIIVMTNEVAIRKLILQEKYNEARLMVVSNLRRKEKIFPNLILLSEIHNLRSKYGKAIIYLKKAINIKDDKVLKVNLALNFIEHGYGQKGKDILIELNNEGYNFNYLKLLGEANIALNRHEDAKKNFEDIVEIELGENLSIASVYLLILEYLEKDYSNIEKRLIDCQWLVGYPNLKSYADYISRLLIYWSSIKKENIQKKQSFFVIGDSHSLGFINSNFRIGFNIFEAVPKWIMGIKAFHLTTEAENQFKKKLNLIKKEIPKYSKIFFSIGEIDLRINEGVIPYAAKSNKKIDEIIKLMVKNYVNYICKIFPLIEYELIFVNVPAPVLTDKFKIYEYETQAEVIFN